MTDIVLSSVDLDVFGGPSTVEVSLDYGATGERGSRVWIGSTAPASALVGQDVKLYDVYINKLTKEMFQYVTQVGSPSWVSVANLGLAEAKYAVVKSFTSGYTYLGILHPKDQFTIDDFVVHTTLEGMGSNVGKPIAHSIVTSISNYDASYDVLYVEIYASVLSSGSWSNLSGNNYVNLSVVAK